jgi:dTDP-L-rhamnose 4-epimerase
MWWPEATGSLVAPRAARRPNSIYAITKRDQEEMVLNIGRTYGIPSVALRYFNIYGPRQSLSNPYTGVAAIFMSRIKNGKPPIIYEDGQQTRDFVSVHDVVRANLLAMERKEADYQVFNIGSASPVRIEHVATKLAQLYEADVKPEVTRRFRKGDVRHCYADISRIKQALGFQPSVSFDQGLRELVAWAETAEARDMFDQAAQELKTRHLV